MIFWGFLGVFGFGNVSEDFLGVFFVKCGSPVTSRARFIFIWYFNTNYRWDKTFYKVYSLFLLFNMYQYKFVSAFFWGTLFKTEERIRLYGFCYILG